MAIRYSKRQPDGSVRYYDSEAEMNADTPDPPGLFDFSWFWALIGFVAFAIVGLVVASRADLFAPWPKGARFAVILGFAVAGAAVIGRIGQALLMTFWFLVGIAVLSGIGGLIWRLA